MQVQHLFSSYYLGSALHAGVKSSGGLFGS